MFNHDHITQSLYKVHVHAQVRVEDGALLDRPFEYFVLAEDVRVGDVLDWATAKATAEVSADEHVKQVESVRLLHLEMVLPYTNLHSIEQLAVLP